MKCCDQSAAQLRKTIIIERKALVPDGYGGQDTTWSQLATIKAKMIPMSGGEYRFGQKVEARITEEITIRYRADLLVTDRILFGNRIFNIRRIFNLEERNRWLTLQCEEGVAP